MDIIKAPKNCYGSLICSIIFLTLLSPSAFAAYPETITATAPWVNIPRPTDDPMWAEAFSHWNKRRENKEIVAAVELFQQLSRTYPDKLETHIWLMRSYYMMGLREKSKRKDWMTKSIEEADKVLSVDPDNEYALYWKLSTINYIRPHTEAELKLAGKLGSQISEIRELWVPENDPAWKIAMKHWDGRWDIEETKKAIEIFRELDKRYPNIIEPKLWLARAYYWRHYISGNKREKAVWLMIGFKHGRRAIEMEPRNPAANWWTATNLAQYSFQTSPLNIAKNAFEILRLLQIVIEEDPNYYYGGLSQFIALGLARAGKIARKGIELLGYPMEQIERAMKFASVYEPRYLRNHFVLAELYIAVGKKEEAREKIDFVLNADPADLPLQEPENKIAQKLVKELLEKHF